MDKRGELIEIIGKTRIYLFWLNHIPEDYAVEHFDKDIDYLADKLLNWHTEQMKDYVHKDSLPREEEIEKIVTKLLEGMPNYEEYMVNSTMKTLLPKTITKLIKG